jgi:type IV pilus assembly protein PilC
MASFTYVAREAGSGREIRNTLDAQNEQAAIAALLGRNLLVLSIAEKVGKKGKTAGGKVALADLVVFTRQLATMIDAGLAMVQSLQALAEQTTNKVMRDTIKDVCTRVEGGDSFSEALVKHPKVFNRLYVCMVAAGERGGLLAEIRAPPLPREHLEAPQEGQVSHDVSGGCDHHCDQDHDLPARQSRPCVWRRL